MKKRNITVSGQEGGFDALKNPPIEEPKIESVQGAPKEENSVEQSSEEDNSLITEDNVVETLGDINETIVPLVPVVDGDHKEAEEKDHFPIKSDYAKRKIDKLTAKNKAKEEEIALLRKQLENASINQFQQNENFFIDPVSGQQFNAPLADRYGNNTPQYIEDMLNYQRAKEMASKMILKREESNIERNMVAATYRQKVEQAKQRYSDYSEIVDSNPLISQLDKAHPEISQDIMASEYSTDIAYYLGKNPELLREIIKLPLLKAGKEIGRLEEIIEMSKNTKLVSKAPKPSLTSTNTGSKTGVTPSSKDYSSMNASDWRERLKERMKKGR